MSGPRRTDCGCLCARHGNCPPAYNPLVVLSLLTAHQSSSPAGPLVQQPSRSTGPAAQQVHWSSSPAGPLVQQPSRSTGPAAQQVHWSSSPASPLVQQPSRSTGPAAQQVHWSSSPAGPLVQQPSKSTGPAAQQVHWSSRPAGVLPQQASRSSQPAAQSLRAARVHSSAGRLGTHHAPDRQPTGLPGAGGDRTAPPSTLWSPAPPTELRLQTDPNRCHRRRKCW